MNRPRKSLNDKYTIKDLNLIHKLIVEVKVIKSSTILLNPSWNKRLDARVTIFSKLINALNCAELALRLKTKHLNRIDWWEETYQIKANSSSLNVTLFKIEFDTFLRIAYIHSVFSAIESSLRQYIKVVNNSVEDSRKGFKSIYSDLLKCADLQDQENILDLLRLLRNLVHNNGVYFDRCGDETVIFRNQEFKFIEGKTVIFVSWELLIKLVYDISKLISDLNKSSIIRSLENVEDPFAVQK